MLCIILWVLGYPCGGPRVLGVDQKTLDFSKSAFLRRALHPQGCSTTVTLSGLEFRVKRFIKFIVPVLPSGLRMLLPSAHASTQTVDTWAPKCYAGTMLGPPQSLDSHGFISPALFPCHKYSHNPGGLTYSDLHATNVLMYKPKCIEQDLRGTGYRPLSTQGLFGNNAGQCSSLLHHPKP